LNLDKDTTNDMWIQWGRSIKDLPRWNKHSYKPFKGSLSMKEGETVDVYIARPLAIVNKMKSFTILVKSSECQ